MKENESNNSDFLRVLLFTIILRVLLQIFYQIYIINTLLQCGYKIASPILH